MPFGNMGSSATDDFFSPIARAGESGAREGALIRSQQVKNDEISRRDMFRQAIEQSGGDIAKLSQLAMAFPEHGKDIQAYLGVKDDKERLDTGRFAQGLGAFMKPGADGKVDMSAVQQYINSEGGRMAQLLASRGMSLQTLQERIQSNPEAVRAWADNYPLATMNPKEVMDHNDSLNKLKQEFDLQSRGMDITMRGQDMTAANAAAGRSSAERLAQMQINAGKGEPASIKEFAFFGKLTPEQQQQYLKITGHADKAPIAMKPVALANGQMINIDPTVHGSGDKAFYQGQDANGNIINVPIAGLATTGSASDGAQQSMVSKDIATLKNATEDQTSDLTGWTGGTGSPAFGADTMTRVGGDPAAREVFNAAQRVQGNMQNQGIGAAKSMGASGINTIQEAKMYFQSMPQIDYSGREAMLNSLQTIQDYTQAYNQKNNVNYGGQQTQGNSASGPANHSSLWGD